MSPFQDLRAFLEALRRGEAPDPPVGELVGFRFVSLEEGEAVYELEAGERHANPMGTVAGGVLVALADVAMGLAFVATLEEGESFTTLELKINFLRPVWTGRLVARGRVVDRGRTIGLTECDVSDEQGRLVAHATSTVTALRGEAAAGR